MISDQIPRLIKDQFDRPSYVQGKTGSWLFNVSLLRTYDIYGSIK